PFAIAKGISMKLTLTDLVGSVDGLTSAVEGLNEYGGGHCTQPAPINELLKTLDAALSLDGLTTAELCALADRRRETFSLLRRFGSRLRWVVGNRPQLPDPDPKLRPTASEALEADTTAYALGA